MRTLTLPSSFYLRSLSALSFYLTLYAVLTQMDLESKILGGKNAGYCSSSEGEEDETMGGFRQVNDDDEHESRVMNQMGGNGATGVKGVLKDYKAFKRQCAEESREKARRVNEMAEKGMLTTSRDERETKNEDEEDSIEYLRERRMAEMRKVLQGRVIELKTKAELLSTIEDTPGLALILLYSPSDDRTQWATHLIRLVASSFPSVRTARITVEIAGMSERFISSGIPAIQVYYGGELTANLVQLHTLIGDDAQLTFLLEILKRNHVSLKRNRMLYDDESDGDSDY